MRFRNFQLPRGEQKTSDVYSFGIILQEMQYRQGPFFTGYDEMSITEKVQGLIDGNLYPWIDDFENIALRQQEYELLRTCLHKESNMRPPDFIVINKELRKMTGKTKKNFGEILMVHYESYLQNLDRQVRQREQEYKRQKFLADQVNSRLLPPGVVEQLKNLGRNEKFDAKSYDEVSLYFSDIVGFTTIGKQSTPQQIMTMMDKLFIMFDDIIGSFRCTKVETIGDAYFVVSGCPDEYEDHAAEIARFALAIRNCYVVDFQIPHLPQERLRMRIGLHTGSVVASVVGNLMPRWCLFGEDLATVANCESLGEANKIHLSSSIFAKLKDAKFADGRHMFELGQDGVRKKSDMRFEISERSFEDEFQFKRVTQVLGTTYFLVKDREKYETEVYNPSSVVERVTMLRQTKRDTNGHIRRVRRSSLHLESGSPSGLAQDIQQVQKMTRFMATSSDTIDTAGIQDISMVEDFSRLTQGNGGTRKGYRESITEMDGMATKLKKRITGRETIIYEGQEIGLRKRSMSNFELTNLDDLFEH